MNEIVIISNIILVVVILGLGFFIKYYLPSYFNEKGKNLATKEDITEITQKIEEVKLNYEKTKVKFSVYHERQALVIAKLYKLLVKALDDIYDLSVPNETRLETANKSSYALKVYYKNHRIYLDEELKTKIEEVIKLMFESIVDYDFSQWDTDMNEKSTYLKSAYKKIDEHAFPISEELENKFRELLSV
ncbi:MAG: hypothetical protein WAR79_15170 [Melioribacteraceae bacterium]